jgi:hypothetical protein
MVKALHHAGIEVILDVVYTHTAEDHAGGATLCFRGFANDTYYILGEDKSTYADYSGCGNTFNGNNPVAGRLILDSLRYWVTDMHVDGFRFDLAAILSRDEHGVPMASPPILWDFESDAVLANVKLIAEPWDAAGLYEIGRFGDDSWKEWNGRFRDDVRAFLKGDRDTARPLAYRLTGSPDVYAGNECKPERGINFVACHDGFTLNDLVSCNVKHNEANGEHNRDGSDQNLSWNCGVEGPTNDPEVQRLRSRQVKNFLALTLLAVGTCPCQKLHPPKTRVKTGYERHEIATPSGATQCDKRRQVSGQVRLPAHVGRSKGTGTSVDQGFEQRSDGEDPAGRPGDEVSAWRCQQDSRRRVELHQPARRRASLTGATPPENGDARSGEGRSAGPLRSECDTVYGAEGTCVAAPETLVGPEPECE